MESNIEYEEECQHHSEEKSTGNDDEHFIAHSEYNRGNEDASCYQSENSVLNYQESFDKSTPPLLDSMNKKAPHDKGRDKNDHAEVCIW